MDYKHLTIIQKIALKGWMQCPSTRPAFFTLKEHNYFDALNAMWIVSDFETAITTFLLSLNSPTQLYKSLFN